MTKDMQSAENNIEEDEGDFESEGGRRKNQSHTVVTKDDKEKLREDQYGRQAQNNQLLPFIERYSHIENDFNMKLNEERLLVGVNPRLLDFLRELIYKQMLTYDSTYQIEPQRRIELCNDIIHQFTFKEKSNVWNFAPEERKLQKFNDIKSSSRSIKNYQEPRKSKNFNQVLINRMQEFVSSKIQNAFWSKELRSKSDFKNNAIIPSVKLHTPELLFKTMNEKPKMIPLDDKKVPEHIYQMGGEEQERRVEVHKPPEGAIKEYFADRGTIGYELKGEHPAEDKNGSCQPKSISGEQVQKNEEELDATRLNSETSPDDENEPDELSEPEEHLIEYTEDAQVEQCSENPVSEKSFMCDDTEQDPDFLKDPVPQEMSEDAIQEYSKEEQRVDQVDQCASPMDSEDHPDKEDDRTEIEEAMHEESKDIQKLPQSKTDSSQDDENHEVQQTENDEDVTESSPTDSGFYDDEDMQENVETYNMVTDEIHDAHVGRLKKDLEDLSLSCTDSGYFADSLPDSKYEDSEKPITSNTAVDSDTKVLQKKESGSVPETVDAEGDISNIQDPKQKKVVRNQNDKDITSLAARVYHYKKHIDEGVIQSYNKNKTENNVNNLITEKYKEPKNFYISEERISENFIENLAEIINTHGDYYKLEFQNCNLTRKMLRLLTTQIKAGKSQMTILTIGFIDNVTDLFPEIREILCLCKPEKLSLEYDDLKDRDLEKLLKTLRSKLESKIALKEMDVSYNKHIGPEGFSAIGKIMREHNINTLKAANCNITDEAIEELRKSLHGTKVFALDISGSKQMTSDGYANLARFITDNDVKRLNLSGCQMTTEKVGTFCEALIKASKEADKKIELEDLDISYNPLMDPEAFKNIGLLVWTCGVKKLSLAGCQLNKDDLARLREVEEKQEMTSVDAADNVTIGTGIIEIARIVKECKLDELNLSDCMFSVCELAAFKEELGDTKLKILDLSDYDRSPNEEHIRQLCKLFLNVTHELRLQFRSLSKPCHRLLQDELNKLPKKELKIIVDNGSISWQEKSKKTEENN